jgi:hypothetical protein
MSAFGDERKANSKSIWKETTVVSFQFSHSLSEGGMENHIKPQKD